MTRRRGQAVAPLQPAVRLVQRRPRGHRAGRGRLRVGHRGNRYLDGLAGLFVVQAGHGRTALAGAAAAQAETLAYFPLWTYAHPHGARARRAARRPRPRRPHPGLLHHRRQRGGGVGVEARPPVLRAHRPDRSATKVISRTTAYHGTTLGALVHHRARRDQGAVRAAAVPAQPQGADLEPLPLPVLRRRRRAP